jgi:hypothetical protein
MKPTTQISHNNHTAFPLTDYNYQPTPEASYVVTKETRNAQRVHQFWRLSTDFHAAEAVYGDAVDFSVFTFMGLICTWPIFSVGMAIYHGLYG